MADRAVNKYGSSKGWRRNRLTTASGFTVDAIGLDTGGRGIKREDQRPDFMIVDDIDGRHDTSATTAKKAATLTDTLLPAGSTDLAVLAVQNLIHTDSIFSQLADGRADFLATRTISGPFPAVHDLAYDIRDGRAVVTGGTPLWAGQDLIAVQHQIDTYGLSAVLRESQQEVRRDPDAALWKRAWIADHRVTAAPQLLRLVVGVDPSGSARGDEVGVIAAGVDLRGHAYIVGDASLHGSPDDWARAAVDLWNAQKGDRIIAETNFGGEMVEHTITTVARERGLRVPIKLVRASRGKAVRADPIAALYQQGLVHHVGPLPALENEICRWTPADPVSPSRLDALVWALSELLLHGGSSDAPLVGGQRETVESYQVY